MEPFIFLLTCMCGGVLIVGLAMLIFLGVSIPAVLLGEGVGASYSSPEKFLKFLYYVCGILILYAILGEILLPEEESFSSFEVFEIFTGYFLGIVIYHIMSLYWEKWEIVESAKSTWVLGGLFLWFSFFMASQFLIAESTRAFELSSFLPENPYFFKVTWDEFYLQNIFSDWGALILFSGITALYFMRTAASLSKNEI